MRSQTGGLKIGLKSKALFAVKIKPKIYDCCRRPDVTCGKRHPAGCFPKGKFCRSLRVALTGVLRIGLSTSAG
jgi:hypothetical protein